MIASLSSLKLSRGINPARIYCQFFRVSPVPGELAIFGDLHATDAKPSGIELARMSEVRRGRRRQIAFDEFPPRGYALEQDLTGAFRKRRKSRLFEKRRPKNF